MFSPVVPNPLSAWRQQFSGAEYGLFVSGVWGCSLVSLFVGLEKGSHSVLLAGLELTM